MNWPVHYVLDFKAQSEEKEGTEETKVWPQQMRLLIDTHKKSSSFSLTETKEVL